MQYYSIVRTDDYISHHGVKGQKWGIRRYQNFDGTWKKTKKQKNKKVTNQKIKSMAMIGAGIAAAVGIGIVLRKIQDAEIKRWKEATDTMLKNSKKVGVNPELDKIREMYKFSFSKQIRSLK